MNPETINKKEHTIYNINERLDKLISKNKHADKYELIKNGLNLVASCAIGIGFPTAVLVAGNLLALPFADEVGQLKLSNTLGPQLMETLNVIAVIAVSNFSSRQVKKYVDKQSKEIENEYSSLKKDVSTLKSIDKPNELYNVTEYLKNKVEKADIISPAQKRETPIGELKERKKKRSSLNFT